MSAIQDTTGIRSQGCKAVEHEVQEERGKIMEMPWSRRYPTTFKNDPQQALSATIPISSPVMSHPWQFWKANFQVFLAFQNVRQI